MRPNDGEQLRQWMERLRHPGHDHHRDRDSHPSDRPEDMNIYSRPLTLARWWHLSGVRRSLLRDLEYEAIDGLRLDGLVLDVGGGENVSYLHLIRFDGRLETLNVDASMRPTYLADITAPLWVPDGRFDHVISFNTLEHVADDDLALAEIRRILKPGGRLYLVVPFLYRVHSAGTTQDFHRHTATGWEEKLRYAQLFPLSIEVLEFGRVASAFSLVEYLCPSALRWPLKKAALLLSLAYESLAGRCAESPLGFYIVAEKR